MTKEQATYILLTKMAQIILKAVLDRVEDDNIVIDDTMSEVDVYKLFVDATNELSLQHVKFNQTHAETIQKIENDEITLEQAIEEIKKKETNENFSFKVSGNDEVN